jgi:hypothetical protein
LVAAAVHGVLALGAPPLFTYAPHQVQRHRPTAMAKGVAETENKAKKKLVSITMEISI